MRNPGPGAHLFATLLCILSTITTKSVASSIQAPIFSVERLKELRSLGQPMSGPNCWNAATYVAGITPYVLLTTEAQASLIFDRQCQQISIAPARAPRGSVIRLRAAGGEAHAFVSLGDGRFFQKRDNSSEGPYQSVSLAEIESIYGRSRYCKEASTCDWTAEVLSCSIGSAFKDIRQMPMVMDESLRATSRLVTGTAADIESQVKHIEQLFVQMSEPQNQRELSAFIRTTDANSAALLFDLAQTIRLVSGDLSRTIGTETADHFARIADASLWPLAEAYLLRKDLSKPEVSIAYDFVYAARAAFGNPAILRDKAALLMARYLSKDNGLLIAKIALLSSPHIPYADAERFVVAGLSSPNKQDKGLIRAFSYFFAHSVSPLATRDRFVATFIKTFKIPEDESIASNLVEAVRNMHAGHDEKETLMRRLLSTQSPSAKEALRAQFEGAPTSAMTD